MLLTFEASPDSINPYIAVKFSNLGIVCRRIYLGSNESGTKEINIKLPFNFKSASFLDNAYGMHYTNDKNGTVSIGNIIFTSLVYNDNGTSIVGYVKYPTKVSYLMYSFIAIGEIKE